MDIHLSALSRARRQLETHGRFPGGALPEEITDSWLRCLSHGLDPLARNSRMILSESEFLAARQSNADLIRFARPELELLYDQIAGSSFMVALGSAEGVVLDRLCDAQFSETGAGAQVVTGSLWAEDLRGTNAMGLTIATHRPAQVYGGEHFMRSHCDVSCISAPIFDGTGRMAGVLDASSTSNVRQQHTAALVQMSATSIENSLIRSGNESLLVMQFHPRPEYLGTLSMGMLVLQEDGRIHAVNRRGEMFLTGFPRMRGEMFDRIFEQKLRDILLRLAQGETLRVRDRLGSAVSMRCVANRASFALARRMSLLSVSPPAPEVPRNLFRDVVIEDPVLWRRLSAMPEAARRGTPIHITGESGTGKAIIARLCHGATARAGKFIAFDARLARDEALARSCFFGSEESPGLLAEAEGGTLFLDHIDAISPAIQSLLIELLDQKSWRPPGSSSPRPADLQIISATTLSEGQPGPGWLQLSAGLRYRLEGFRIALPPLRERSDLAPLAERFVRASRPGLRLDPAALARLAAHSWPGNLHELRAVLSQAALQARGEVLGPGDLAPLLGVSAPPAPQEARDVCPACTGSPWKEESCRRMRALVARHEGNISRAARELGMSRTTLYKHLGPQNCEADAPPGLEAGA